MIRILHGDCLDVLPTLEAASFDAVVTDPPYHLTSIVERFGKPGSAPAKHGTDGAFARASKGFMGKEWDGGSIAFQPETWAQVYRVLKPGGHMVCFGGTRTAHRMTCAIEDAGFEIRDTLCWLYGTGFPKSLDIGKAIDKAAGAVREVVGPSNRHVSGKPDQRTEGLSGTSTFAETVGMGATVTAPATPEATQWQGWGSALKPAHEPIVLARKPLDNCTIASNVLKHSTGALNIDACRVGTEENTRRAGCAQMFSKGGIRDDNGNSAPGRSDTGSDNGRFPANVLHDGSDEVMAAFGDRKVGAAGGTRSSASGVFEGGHSGGQPHGGFGDSGTAARFFKSCPYSEEEWTALTSASAAASLFDLRSEQSVSALSDAVALSMQPLVLLPESYLGQSTSVTENELRIVCGSVTALIQNLGPRFWQEWPDGRLTLNNDPVICVARQRPIGTTTITVSLLKSDGCVELATFNIIEMSGEPGEKASPRFHYSSKANAKDRADSKHPTVKPLALMEWLVKLITPPGGVVLDPFAGSGITAEACMKLEVDCTLVDIDATNVRDIRHRIKRWSGLDSPLFAETAS